MTPAQILKILASDERSEEFESINQKLDQARQILRDALAAWNAPNRFERGDIVKPAKHSSLWNSKTGHCIVLRTHEDIEEYDPAAKRVFWSNMRLLLIEGDEGIVNEIKAHSRDFELVERIR